MSNKKNKKSIVTGKGDTGYTYTLSGDKIRKDDILLEVVGTIDELSSFIGLAKSLSKNKTTEDVLDKIQRDLLILGTQICKGNSNKLKKNIGREHIQYLECKIEKLEEHLSFDNFVLTGDDLPSSSLHILHTVTRRLERRVVTLTDETDFEDKNVLVYLNRLSDLLFLLACDCSCKQRIKSRKNKAISERKSTQ